MKILPILILLLALNLSSSAQESLSDFNVIKISLTDFAIGQYTLGYERMMGNDWSVNATVSGVGYAVNSRSFSMGSYYNEWGEWFNIESEMEAQVEGFGTSIGLRKYSVHEGLELHGLYGGVFAQWRNCKTDFIEDFENFEAFSEFYSLEYPHNLNHTSTMNSLGVGVELGYHWLSDNGLSLDVFAGPMFRSFKRENTFESLPMSEANAEDGLDDRFRNHYYTSPQFSDLYQGRTGSWFRAGITLGLKL